jgi:hypothetical protein
MGSVYQKSIVVTLKRRRRTSWLFLRTRRMVWVVGMVCLVWQSVHSYVQARRQVTQLQAALRSQLRFVVSHERDLLDHPMIKNNDDEQEVQLHRLRSMQQRLTQHLSRSPTLEDVIPSDMPLTDLAKLLYKQQQKLPQQQPQYTIPRMQLQQQHTPQQ